MTFNMKFSRIMEVFFFLVGFLNHKTYQLGLM